MNAGGVTLIGTYSGALDFPGYSIYGALSEELFLAKFDLSLNTVWLSGIVSSHGAAGYDINTVQISGTYYSYITGFFGHTIAGPGSTIQFSPVTLTSYGGTDVFIAKFVNNNTAPSFTWAKKAGSNVSQSGRVCDANEAGYGITVDGNGVAYITGKVRGRPG